MTETCGYLCPTCLGWWTTYLNKKGPDQQELYCGCHVSKSRALYLYKKTYGNHYLAKDGVTTLHVEITWAGELLEFDTVEWVEDAELWRLLDAKLAEKGEQVLLQNKGLLFIALKKATRQASSKSVFERCTKCEEYRTCRKLGVWLELSCGKFGLNKKIQEFLDRGKKPIYMQPEMR